MDPGEYHYFASFLVSFGYRLNPEADLTLKRIWFGGNLVYTDADTKPQTGVKWYFKPGALDQDPIVGDIAYRGQILLWFSDVDLGTSPTIPQVSAEFWDGTDATVFSTVQSLAEYAGMDESDLDIDAGLMDVDLLGYILGAQSTLESVLTDLAFLYNFNYSEGLGKIRITFSYDVDTGLFSPDVTIPDGKLAVISEGGTDPQIDVIAVGSDQQLPRSITASYFAYDNNYQTGSQTAFRRGDASASQQSVSLSMPVVMTGSEMRSRLFDALARTWNERNTHSLRLPRSYMAVETGTTLQWQSYDNTYNGVVVKATLNGDWSNTLSVTQQNSEFAPNSVATTDPNNPTDYVNPQPVVAVIMDVPDWDEAQTTEGVLNVRVAIGRADDATGWLGAHFDWADATNRVVWTSPAVFSPTGEVGIGSLVSDDSTSLTLTLRNLQVSDFAADDKLLIVGRPGAWEELTFDTCTDNHDGTVTISDLTRGLHGTDNWIDQHAAADTVVFANKTQTINYSVDEYRAFKQFAWRAVPFYMNPIEATQNVWVPSGNSRRPYSPNDVTLVRQGSGDIDISWTRDDGRFGGEPDSNYSLDIYSDAGDILVRRASVTTESYTYTAANQLTDGLNLATTINILVYQINASHVGRGFPGGGAISVTEAGELSGRIGPVGGFHQIDQGALAGRIGPVEGLTGVLAPSGQHSFITGHMGAFGGSISVLQPNAIAVSAAMGGFGGSAVITSQNDAAITGDMGTFGGSAAVTVAAASSHQYWRIHVTASNGSVGLDTHEILLTIGGANQTGAGTASASSYYVPDGLTPDKAFDGIDTGALSRWASDFSGTWPQWIEYDFGSGNEKAINGFSWSCASATDRTPKDFTVDYSDDGSTWTTAATFTGQTSYTLNTYTSYSF